MDIGSIVDQLEANVGKALLCSNHKGSSSVLFMLSIMYADNDFSRLGRHEKLFVYPIYTCAQLI